MILTKENVEFKADENTQRTILATNEELIFISSLK